MKNTRFASIMILALIFNSAYAQYQNERIIVSGDLEYYMATDKIIYIQGDSVKMLHKITNIGQDTLEFHFTSSQEFDFFVNGGALWRWSYGMVFLQIMMDRLLLPGESMDAYWKWNMINNEGNIVPPGNYEVSGTFVYYSPQPLLISVFIEIISSSDINRNSTQCMTYKLEQNYPNPFNDNTKILFSIAKDAPVELRIYDINGQLVKTLVDENMKPGAYSVIWYGLDENKVHVASGVYIIQMQTEQYVANRKMILLR